MRASLLDTEIKTRPVLCENPAEPRLRKIAALTSAAGTLFPLERSINERPRHARLEPRRAAESIYRQWIRYHVSGEFVNSWSQCAVDRLHHAADAVIASIRTKEGLRPFRLAPCRLGDRSSWRSIGSLAPNWPQILVEPIQGLTNLLTMRQVAVPSFVDHVFLVRVRCAEETKRRKLGRRERKSGIVPAVQH
jgi:hypothetical protein